MIYFLAQEVGGGVISVTIFATFTKLRPNATNRRVKSLLATPDAPNMSGTPSFLGLYLNQVALGEMKAVL